MASVYVDVETVTENVTKMKREIDQQSQDLSNIAGEIGFMDDTWEDQAQKVYVNNFQDTRSRIEKFNQALNAYLDKFQAFVNKVNEDDQNRARTLANITW